MDASYPHHVDVKNPHSFEARDLEKLIQKVIFHSIPEPDICSYKLSLISMQRDDSKLYVGHSKPEICHNKSSLILEYCLVYHTLYMGQ